MSREDVLGYIGRIEQCVLVQPATGNNNTEALATIEKNLNGLLRRHGWYRFVAERSARISELARELYDADTPPQRLVESPPEALKLAILKECVALRRYISRIKT